MLALKTSVWVAREEEEGGGSADGGGVGWGISRRIMRKRRRGMRMRRKPTKLKREMKEKDKNE